MMWYNFIPRAIKDMRMTKSTWWVRSSSLPVVVRQWVITSLERTTMPKKSKIGITTLPTNNTKATKILLQKNKSRNRHILLSPYGNGGDTTWVTPSYCYVRLLLSTHHTPGGYYIIQISPMRGGGVVKYNHILNQSDRCTHRWDLPVLHYHKMMVIYPYPFLVIITLLFSCIIFVNDFICILTGSSR